MKIRTKKIFATRLDNETLSYINTVSDKNKIDKSESFRMLLRKGIEIDRKQRSIELYMEGKLSLEGASKFARLYIGEFLELMREKGVESNLTLNLVKKGMFNAKNKEL
ncbi:hypothetical protein CL617_01700 [archaeon]|nr:hypothetical protein [archaeon]|tara:strand:+ start:786 stop:1109 length:324 start_codon:yes stop_codon:yes gene_type:complete